MILAIVGVVRKGHADLSEDMHKHQKQPGSGAAHAGVVTNEFGWQATSYQTQSLVLYLFARGTVRK